MNENCCTVVGYWLVALTMYMCIICDIMRKLHLIRKRPTIYFFITPPHTMKWHLQATSSVTMIFISFGVWKKQKTNKKQNSAKQKPCDLQYKKCLHLLYAESNFRQTTTNNNLNTKKYSATANSYFQILHLKRNEKKSNRCTFST